MAVKAGRSTAGSRAAASHTGALASSDTVVDALFRQAGVIRTERLEELFDVAALLSHQPLPRGASVAILTNAGGPGILAADACEANGLELPALERGDARRAARRFCPPPPASAIPSTCWRRRRRTTTGARSPRSCATTSVDSVIAIFIPPLVTEPDEVAAAIAEGARERRGKAGAGRVHARGGRARRRWRRFRATPFPNPRRWRSRE